MTQICGTSTSSRWLGSCGVRACAGLDRANALSCWLRSLCAQPCPRARSSIPTPFRPRLPSRHPRAPQETSLNLHGTVAARLCCALGCSSSGVHAWSGWCKCARASTGWRYRPRAASGALLGAQPVAALPSPHLPPSPHTQRSPGEPSIQAPWPPNNRSFHSSGCRRR